MKIILDQEKISETSSQTQLTIKFVPQGGDEESRLKSIVNLFKEKITIEQNYVNP